MSEQSDYLGRFVCDAMSRFIAILFAGVLLLIVWNLMIDWRVEREKERLKVEIEQRLKRK